MAASREAAARGYPDQRGRGGGGLGGHVVTTDELEQLPEPLPASDIQITDVLHLVAPSGDEYEPVMLFINHSCDPTSASPATPS